MSEEKVHYKLKNRKAYDQSLCRPGSITLWLPDEVLRQRGELATQPIVVGQCRYPEAIIRVALTIRSVFRLSLRQSTGFLRSILTLTGQSALPVPDRSTLSRRALGLSVCLLPDSSGQPIDIAVDSTGLKACRGGG